MGGRPHAMPSSTPEPLVRIGIVSGGRAIPPGCMRASAKIPMVGTSDYQQSHASCQFLQSKLVNREPWLYRCSLEVYRDPVAYIVSCVSLDDDRDLLPFSYGSPGSHVGVPGSTTISFQPVDSDCPDECEIRTPGHEILHRKHYSAILRGLELPDIG